MLTMPTGITIGVRYRGRQLPKGAVVSWASSTQRFSTLSRTEADSVALGESVKEGGSSQGTSGVHRQVS